MGMVPAAELLGKVANEYVQDIPKNVTKAIVKSFIGQIQQAIADKKTVRIDGIGIFKIKQYAPRKGRNPQTGDELDIPATTKVSFKASKILRDTLKGKAKIKKARKPAAKKGK